MTEVSSEITEEASNVSFAKRAAKFSILAPVISTLINLTVGRQMSDRTSKIVVGGVCMLFIITGMICAIAALVGIRRHGKKGILRLAIAGLLVNTVIIVLFLSLWNALHRVKTSRMMSKEELMSLPNVLVNSVKIIDDKLGFRLELPAGFHEWKEGYNRHGVIHSYAKLSPAGDTAFVVIIERLGGVIKDLTMPDSAIEQVLAMMPAGSRAERIELSWKGRTIEGLASNMPINGERVTSYVVQIPLKLEAIQINLAAPPGMEAEAKAILSQVLDTLAGKAIWE